MKRYKNPDQKLLVFSFQRQSKPVDDRPENFQQLPNTVKVFGFIDKPEQKNCFKVALVKLEAFQSISTLYKDLMEMNKLRYKRKDVS